MIGELLYTMLPVILGGVGNMIWVKTPYWRAAQKPMDAGRHWRDGKRLFGDNKTWKGFWGMVVLTAMSTTAFQWLALQFPATESWSIVPLTTFRWPAGGLLVGALWGLAYVLFELPNSFVKRRIGIAPGSNASGLTGHFFKLIDQIDSVIGCVLVMPLFSPITWEQGLALIVLATVIHLIVNVLLYLVGLKGQAG